MEYKINKKKLPIRFRDIRETKSGPYWISDAKDAMEPGQIDRLHYHNMCELGICIQGSGEVQIDDKVYRFKQGDIELIGSYVPHFSNSDLDAPAYWKLIFFDPLKLMQLAGMLDPEKALLTANINIPCSAVFSPDDNPKLTSFIKNIMEQCEIQDEYTDSSLAFAIGTFLISCARYTKTHQISSKPTTLEKRNYYRIAPAIDRINAHINDHEMLKEENLAKLCNISISTLRRAFIKHVGMSPKVYINQTRMAYAEYLLKNTNMSIFEISSKVGYGEVSGFNRIFKSVFSISPSEYRKNN